MILVLLVGLCAAQQTGYFTTQFSWTNTDGAQTRSLRMYVPTTYNANDSYTLVIGFHGLGDSPNNYMQGISYYGTNSYFGKVIVACPSEGTASTSWFSGTEDFKIISAIINHVKSTYNIDTTRVFAQGFSFGGKSAYLHGLDEADFLKGIIAHSPGFYSTADIYNTCTDPVHCQHKYNYNNAWKLKACITAGSGEYNLGLTEPYLTLASKAAARLRYWGCDAIFIEDPTGYHNLPPLTIVKSCWDHVNLPSTGISEQANSHKFRLYPNPAKHYICFEDPMPGLDKIVSIMNMTGFVVKHLTLKEGNNTVLLDNLPDGIYLFRLSDEDGTKVWSSRLVVVR